MDLSVDQISVLMCGESKCTHVWSIGWSRFAQLTQIYISTPNVLIYMET